MTRLSDNFMSAEDTKMLDKPGVLFRLKANALGYANELSREDLAHLQRDIGQFRRAEDGDRARPDLYSPESIEPSVANQHGYPTPFMPRDTHRPDRLANAEAMAHMKRINQRLEDEQVTAGVQEKMGTDDQRPLPPPSLRDQIEAAANLHSR